MGRRSIADNIIDGIDAKDDDSLWIVCYDFDQDVHLRRFYKNRDRILSKLGGVMIQYSVFISSLPASIALFKLVKLYDGGVLRLELIPDQQYFV